MVRFLVLRSYEVSLILGRVGELPDQYFRSLSTRFIPAEQAGQVNFNSGQVNAARYHVPGFGDLFMACVDDVTALRLYKLVAVNIFGY